MILNENIKTMKKLEKLICEASKDELIMILPVGVPHHNGEMGVRETLAMFGYHRTISCMDTYFDISRKSRFRYVFVVNTVTKKGTEGIVANTIINRSSDNVFDTEQGFKNRLAQLHLKKGDFGYFQNGKSEPKLERFMGLVTAPMCKGEFICGTTVYENFIRFAEEHEKPAVHLTSEPLRAEPKCYSSIKTLTTPPTITLPKGFSVTIMDGDRDTGITISGKSDKSEVTFKFL